MAGRVGEVFGVSDRLVEQRGDVRVMQDILDMPALTAAHDQTEIAQDTKLLADRGLFHVDATLELADRERPVAEQGQEANAARGGENQHRLRDPFGGLDADPDLRPGVLGVAHPRNATGLACSCLHLLPGLLWERFGRCGCRRHQIARMLVQPRGRSFRGRVLPSIDGRNRERLAIRVGSGYGASICVRTVGSGAQSEEWARWKLRRLGRAGDRVCGCSGPRWTGVSDARCS
jgi:hypothetical protein